MSKTAEQHLYESYVGCNNLYKLSKANSISETSNLKSPRHNLSSDLKVVENYTLGLLTEECGEVSQAAGKCIRFGIDTPGPKNLTGREMLNLECGDILAAIEYGIQKGVLDKEKIQKYMVDKLEKLLNPNSVDNLGRRLAP